MFQTTQALQISRRVDDSLDPQGTTVFQILFDPRVLEERVHRDLGADGDDSGFAWCPVHDRMRPAGVRGVTGEEQLDTFRSTDIQVIPHQCAEEGTGVAGCVKDDGARYLDLSSPEFVRGSVRPVPSL
ncbi:hypothetical protein GCM10027056_08330 [Glaciibacter psychrotolerans]